AATGTSSAAWPRTTASARPHWPHTNASTRKRTTAPRYGSSRSEGWRRWGRTKFVRRSRFKTIARGESEANTPRREDAHGFVPRQRRTGKHRATLLVPPTRHESIANPLSRVFASLSPLAIFLGRSPATRAPSRYHPPLHVPDHPPQCDRRVGER